MKQFLNIVYGILIGLLAAGLIWMVVSSPRGEPVVLLPSSTPGMITIYVNGAVNSPGLYNLPYGSRADAAITAAGGFGPGAETEKINLAALLEDGEQIDVPGVIDLSHISAGRVNINTADESELDTLPGIGPTTAEAIIEYRQQNGAFQTVQELMLVPGVGPSTFDRIKNYITVEP